MMRWWRDKMPRNFGSRNKYVWQLNQSIDRETPGLPASLKGDLLSEGDNYITLRLTADEFAKLYSAVLTGADLAYPDQAHEVVWLLQHWVEYPIATPTKTEIVEIFTGACGAGSDYLEDLEQEIEDMARTWVEQVGGKWYLKSDCSGCQPVMFELTRVTVGSDGSPISAEDGGSEIAAWQSSTEVSSGNVSCYAAKAAAIIQERASYFAEQCAKWGLFGMDALTYLDEFAIDLPALAVELVMGENSLSDFLDFDPQEISDAINRGEVTTAITNNWELTGAITRLDLTWLFEAVPATLVEGGNAILVRSSMLNWAAWCNLEELNQALAIAAAECESGNALPSGNVDLTGGYYATLIAEDFPVYNDMPATAVNDCPGTPIALAAYGQDPVGDASCGAYLTIGGITWNHFNPGTTGAWWARGDETAYTAFENWLGVTLSNKQPVTLPYESGGSGQIAVQNGNSGAGWSFGKLYAIWEA